MSGDSFTPEELDLIRKLQAVAKTRLSDRTMDAIRHRMLSEMDAPTSPYAVRRPVVLRRSWFAIGVAAALTLVIAGVLLTNRPPNSIQITLTALQTRVAAGDTQTPTIASLEASSTPTPTITATVEVAHTVTAHIENVTPTPIPVVTLTASPTAPPEVPSATSTPETVIALEGPIERIQGNTIEIYGIDIAIPAGNPILNIVEVGDVIRVEGSFDDQTGFMATAIENLLDDADTATVGLDGPIEAIDGEYVTINGIELDLSESATVIEGLSVGDFLSVRGNIETRGSRFVLAVVGIEVLPNVDIATPAGCYYHDPGMGMGMGMGHWHCEGMGMGMGMGQPP